MDSEGEKVIEWDWDSIKVSMFRPESKVPLEFFVPLIDYAEPEIVRNLYGVIGWLMLDAWHIVVSEGPE